jgi:hypothetical protein
MRVDSMNQKIEKLNPASSGQLGGGADSPVDDKTALPERESSKTSPKVASPKSKVPHANDWVHVQLMGDAVRLRNLPKDSPRRKPSLPKIGGGS